MAVIDLDILHLAELARINLTKDEVMRFHEQIGGILGYIDQLQAIETAGVEETAQVTGLVNVLREDLDEDSGFRIQDSEELQKRREELLAAVPETEAEMVKVPAIL